MTDSPDNNGRISVSKDFLRAELGHMELRLIEKLATKSEVELVAVRLNAHDKRLSMLERRDGDDEAIRKRSEAQFSRREKTIAVVLAFAALAAQILITKGLL